MLKLLTGAPGNGKTLWILKAVHEQAKREARPVFYSGIPLTETGKQVLGWQELGDIANCVESVVDPTDGTKKCRFTLPPNSIIVIDEAQRIFRVRSQGSQVPPVVAAFETHRHEGIDFWLLSQNPGLLDTHVRKLAGYHVNVRRAAGLERTNVYEWEQCETDPLSDRAKKIARHSVWRFPPEVYGWYTSAEVHTHKRNLPWKQIVALGAAVAFVLASASYTVWHLTHGAGVEGLESEVAAGEQDVDARPGRLPSDGRNPWQVEYRLPRVDGWDRTAPVYDELQKAKSQPKVGGCMQLRIGSVTTCRCYTSQRSLLPLDRHECARLIREGWFDETQREVSSKEENIRYLNARDSGGQDSQVEKAPSTQVASAAS